MRNPRQWIEAAAVAILLLGGGIGIGLAIAPTPTPKAVAPKAIAPACQNDPTIEASLAATPVGTTWPGSGCYSVPTGTVIPTGVNLTNVSFVDASTTHPAKGPLRPIVTLLDDTGNVLTNVSVTGANPTGKFGGSLVGEAGFKLEHTTNITMINDSAEGTFGDCMEIFASGPKDDAPNTGLNVSGFHADHCGRDGISPSDVNGATFTNTVIGQAHQASIDFESDLKGLGAGNVVFDGGSWLGTIITETLTGPVTINGATLANHVLDSSNNHQAYPVLFENGSLAGWTKSSAIVAITGPNALTFDHWSFTRQSGKRSAPLWRVIDGGHLTLTSSTFAPPLGSPTAGVKAKDGSLVTVMP